MLKRKYIIIGFIVVVLIIGGYLIFLKTQCEKFSDDNCSWGCKELCVELEEETKCFCLPPNFLQDKMRIQ